LKTKADIIKFLKEFFPLGHKAVPQACGEAEEGSVIAMDLWTWTLIAMNSNYYFALVKKRYPQYVKDSWHRLSSPTGRNGYARCGL